MERLANFPEAYKKARPIPPPLPGPRDSVFDSRIIAFKELTQVANRRGFHFEKFFFVFVSAAIFAWFAFYLTGGWRTDLRRMSTFGRASFQPVSLFACVVLSFSSLISATGIVMSEAVGKRLDLLRITPLSLGAVVVGKAASVFAKAGLAAVLLLPILATTQLLGGVSKSDVLIYLVLTLTDVFFVTALGVYVSAGAKTNTDRILRSGEAVTLWLLLTLFLDLPCFAAAPTVSFSPIRIWSLYMASKWSVLGLFLNVAFHVAVGIRLLRSAAKRLLNTALAVEIASGRPEDNSLLTAEDPNVEHLLTGIWRTRSRRKKAKAVSAERKWAGTLVGSQILHTSLVAVLLPLAVGVPQALIFFLSLITGRGAYDSGENFSALVSTSLGSAVVLMLLIQSCSLLAREKSRHTAEILAVTPEGGASMLWWKGAAAAASQVVSLALCVAMLLLGGLVGATPFELALLNLLGFLALIILIFSAGVSFSLASRSSYEAFAFLVVSVLFLSPFFYFLLERLMRVLTGRALHGLVFSWSNQYAFGGSLPVVAWTFLIILVPALTLIGLRNLFPRAARFVLAVGFALGLAGIAFLIPFGDPDFPRLLLPLVPLMSVLDYRQANMLQCTFLCVSAQLVLSAALLGGCFLNFTPTFLFGAKPKD